MFVCLWTWVWNINGSSQPPALIESLGERLFGRYKRRQRFRQPVNDVHSNCGEQLVKFNRTETTYWGNLGTFSLSSGIGPNWARVHS